MRQDTIERVQASFPHIAAIAPDAARLFYARLFEIDPSTAPLFAKTDMQAQGQKLMATLGYIVGQLYRPERLIPAAQDLARRHAAYGVALPHYDSVGATLIWTLEQGLGDAFTPELRQAWEETYALLAGVMREAAAEPA